MKKVILSVGVVLVFVGYVVYQKLAVSAPIVSDNGDNNPITTPVDTPTSEPVPTPQPTPTPVVPTPTPTPTPSAMYKDGSYTGDSISFLYGHMQIKAVVSGGRLTDVVFLDYPQDRPTSVQINTQAMPILKSAVIKSQLANADVISGATDSSKAFNQSLETALVLAKN